jgi:hypothetical protein
LSFEPKSGEGEIFSKEKLCFHDEYIYYFDDEKEALKRVKLKIFKNL